MTEQTNGTVDLPKRTGYAETLHLLSEDAKSDIEKAGAVSIVFDAALEDASHELITSSTDKTPYSREQLTAQFLEAATFLGDGDFESAVRRIPSSGGLRSAFRELITSPGGKENFEAYVARFERLDDEERERIEKEVGEEALDASGVPDPEPEDDDFEHARVYSSRELRELREKAASLFDQQEATPHQAPEQQAEPVTIESLTAGLSEDDKNELRSFAVNHELMLEARQEGDGKEAQLREQYKGQSLREMTDAAKSVSQQYLSLYMKERSI